MKFRALPVRRCNTKNQKVLNVTGATVDRDAVRERIADNFAPEWLAFTFWSVAAVVKSTRSESRLVRLVQQSLVRASLWSNVLPISQGD